MRRDRRPFVMLHDGYPEHPKVLGLSDKAFRAHVSLLCWARRQNTDGHIPESVLKAFTTAKVLRELVTNRLLDQKETGTFLHDYLEHQPSSTERSQLSEDRESAGRRGAHTRHHLRKGVYQPDCAFCLEEGKPPSKSPSNPLASASDFRSKPLAEVEVEKELTTTGGSAPVRTAHANDMHHPPRGASGPNSTAAFRLVDDTLRGQKLTSITRTALAVEVTRLWPEAEPDEIRAALLRWNSRTNIGASLLPGLLDDMRKESRGATSRAAHTAPALAPSDAFVANFLSTPAQPELRALPGGA